jgi:hypothetical protein
MMRAQQEVRMRRRFLVGLIDQETLAPGRLADVIAVRGDVLTHRPPEGRRDRDQGRQSREVIPKSLW